MAEEKEKKYFWLKLRKDFFKDHKVIILENMPNGKDYVLFYLKLLTESTSHEGYLRFSDTLPYNVEMLSSITNTNIDIVRSAIKILQELQLLEIMDDETLYLTESSKMLGFQTQWAIEKAEYRERKKDSQNLIVSDNVRTMSRQKKTMSDKRLEIRDKNKELNNIVGNEKTSSTALIKDIVEYLNRNANTKYKSNAQKTAYHVKARINEGYVLGDFKKVIDIKCAEWLGTIQEKYLRPETLFGNKFESYLNQKPEIKKTNGKQDIKHPEWVDDYVEDLKKGF